MARSRNRRLAAVLAATAALSGCEDGKSPFTKAENTTAGAAETTASTSSVRLVDRDVEAPEVFQVTDQGLWDGRPSLGGVWVATSDAKDPERVIIRNPANGKFVIGALFRRERDNPGPKVQISSDAAEALGLLAGQPGQISITALRRDETPATAPDATQPILDGPETVATETALASAAPASETAAPAAPAPLDTAVMAAAIDKAEGKAPAETVAADAGTTAAAVTEPAAKKKWWQRKAKEPAQAEAPAPDAAADAAPVAAMTAAEITTASIASTPTPAPASKPASSGGGKSLIQLGIFSVEANAQRAADTVTKSGSSATVRKELTKGKIFWSVVAGPANTPAEREALLKKVKGLGFTDAYYVSR